MKKTKRMSRVDYTRLSKLMAIAAYHREYRYLREIETEILLHEAYFGASAQCEELWMPPTIYAPLFIHDRSSRESMESFVLS